MIDLSKLETMFKYPIVTKKQTVPAFVAFANHYERFIVNYDIQACPLINLIKDVPFTCRHAQQQFFDGF